MSVSIALELTQSLLTNGARAAAVFFLQSCYFLAIPQFAHDVPGTAANVHGGNSDVSLQLFRANEGTSHFEKYQDLDVPGGQDAEFFTIDDRVFLATATARSGTDLDYKMDVDSCIFEWIEEKMEKFQCIQTLGARQWHHFEIEERHFLALAQGLEDMPEAQVTTTNSTIYEWDGDQFRSFQTVPSTLGYNWLHFMLDGRSLLAYADDSESYVLEWDGHKFIHFQTLDGTSGRAFCFYENNHRTFLAFARAVSDSIVYQWDGRKFQHYRTLPGAGGTELALINDDEALYLVLVRHLTGDLNCPDTAMKSTIYHIGEDGLDITTEFPTYGGTDAKTFSVKDQTYMVVTESLTKEARLRQDSHIYQVTSKRSHTPATKRSAYQTPEFLDLFAVYTSGDKSIGFQLRNATTQAQDSLPIIVATPTDIIVYPGNGMDPSSLKYRLTSGGFMELASISHLGPAVASLVKLKDLGTDQEEWQRLATRLRNKAQAANEANSVSLWKEKISVVTFEGREASIAAMINYACDLTMRVLDAVLADPTKLTDKFVRETYLEASGDAFNATISYNAVMISTFFLLGLDTSYRVQKWLNQYDIDWKKAGVMVTGQQGRETASVTISSSSAAQIFLRSFDDLQVDRLLIAPHGPAPTITNKTADALREYEASFRELWSGNYAVSELGGSMFAGYPSYQVVNYTYPEINASTTSVSELPAIDSPHDWLAMTTRLRVTLEDVRQALSGCVTDYAAQQLHDVGGDLTRVVVPGLDGYNYVSAAAQLSG